MNQPWSSLAVPPDAIIVAQNGSPSALAELTTGCVESGSMPWRWRFAHGLSQLHTTPPSQEGRAEVLDADSLIEHLQALRVETLDVLAATKEACEGTAFRARGVPRSRELL